MGSSTQTFQIVTDVVLDVPAVVGLIQAIQASVAAHKGESGLDTGLDVLGDVLPQLSALVKTIERQLAPAPAVPVPAVK
jgi:hypothetical protein